MARNATDAPPERQRWPVAALAVAGAGAVASIAACAIVLLAQGSSVERAFDSVAAGVKSSLAQECEEPPELLQSLRALWLSSDDVTRPEFRRFAAHLKSISPSVVELAWIERVTAEKRAEFEQRITDDLKRDARIHSSDGAPVPEGAESFAVEFRQRDDPLVDQVGLDLAHDPQYRPLFDRARASEKAAARFERAGDGRTHVVAVLPIRKGPTPASEELLGFAVGRWDLQTIVDEAFERVPASSAGALLRPGTGEVLASNGVDAAHAAALGASGHKADFEVTIGDAPLDVTCAPTRAWLDEHSSSLAWVLLLGGWLVSFALAWYLASIEQRRVALTRANAELYTEIAERHTIEKELRETQRQLETLVSNLPGLAYRCRNDADWTMEFISDGCIPLTGFKPADFYSGKVSFGQRVIHEADRERVWDEVQTSLDDRMPFRLVYRIVTAFGDERWVWEQGRGVYSRAGELLALEGFITDITERRRAEQQLQREKGFSDVIVASLPGNFYVFDERGKFVRWNDNVERVTGYTPAELARMKPLDFFAPVDQPAIARAVQEVFEDGNTQVEADMLAKDGSRLPYFFTGVRFVWENTRFLVGVGIDVRERNQARDERERLLASLLPAQKLESVGVLAGAIAHDFNNLLTVVLGNAGLAQRSVAPGSSAHEHLQQVLDASRNASYLTRQLLDYADLAGRARREVDVSEEITEFAALLRSSVPRAVVLELELGQGLPLIEADPAQIQQLTLNLVLNAAEVYGDGGGRVVVRTSSEVVDERAARTHALRGEARPGRCVAISVHDEGAGLDAATLARVGELFFTTKLAGRGLGLAAVLGILRAHGGWLHVESKPGRGSLFAAYFPVTKSAARSDA
jgi:PAS domain S-box-containing protein